MSSDGQIEDIDYLKNKLFAALKIPKAFLGYDEGVDGKATLAAEDVRFARTIERIQKIFVSELTKIAIVHLYSQGFKDEDLIGFELSLTNPSLIYEKQKVETLNEKIGLATSMIESTLFSQRWVYENIFGLSQDEWLAEQEQVIEDIKQTFSTPHDIASMHVANKDGLLPGQEQEHVAGPGRPQGPINGKSHNSTFGRDPLAAKSLANTFSTDNSPLDHKYKNGSPLSTENVEIHNLIDSMKVSFKSPKIIQQSMINEKKIDDNGTMLDEGQLLEE